SPPDLPSFPTRRSSDLPIIVVALLSAPGGLNLAAIILMLMGTQWYLLFNVIAGAMAIPQDLRFTTDLLRLRLIDRWRVFILPARSEEHTSELQSRSDLV